MSAQSMSALARANEVRFAQAAVKEQINTGLMGIDEAVGMECCQTMRVYDLLRAQKGWGPKKALNELERLEIGHYRLVGDLTPRQKELWS